MGHTPGPWTIECEDDDGELYEDGVRIDSPEGPVAFNVIDCSAHLIAAAPELLAVCKRVASDLSMVLWKDGCGYTLCGSPARTEQLLREAIAKAEGGADETTPD